MLTRPIRQCLALAAGLTFAGIAAAALEIDDYASAAAAYQRGDFTEAWRIWEPLARSGDVDAQFSLGMLCDREPPPASCAAASAIDWYTRAAQSGHRLAQFSLGNAYREGRGVPPDESRARYWFGKAAAQGLPAARDALRATAAESPGAPSALAGDDVAPPEKEAPASAAQPPAAEPPPAIAGQSPAVPEPSLVAAGSTSRPAAAQPDAEWLAAQDPERYTAQLAASPDEAGLRSFRRRHALEERARVVCARSLCYLLLGAFISREDAWSAIATLPEAVRAGKPWPRAFAYYQSRLL
jgi:TPR repeat protein